MTTTTDTRTTTRSTPAGYVSTSLIPVIMFNGMLAVAVLIASQGGIPSSYIRAVLLAVATITALALCLRAHRAALSGKPVHPAVQFVAYAFLALTCVALILVALISYFDPEMIGLGGAR